VIVACGFSCLKRLPWAFAAASAGVANSIAHAQEKAFTLNEALGIGQNQDKILLLHTLSQGVIASLKGDRFIEGAVAGYLGKVSGKFSVGLDRVSSTMVSGMFGGLGATATGGDFLQGAMTAASVHLYNDLAGAQKGCSGQMCRGAGKPSASENHYARNAENDAFFKEQGLYGRNDLTTDEIQNAGEFGFKKVSESETAFHRNGPGNENNLKFTSLVSRRENWFQRTFSNRYGRYELIVRQMEMERSHM
jgi:hypothetical protein